MAAIVYALPDLGQYCRPGLLFLASWALFIIYRTLLGKRDPNTLPYFDRPPGKTGFSLRTYYRYYTDCGGLMREAYEKFLSKGKPVFIPGLGSRKELILPNTSMKWALAQPPHILNQRAGVLEQDCPKYLLGDDSFLTDPWQGLLIKAELQPSLDHVCAVMNVELEAAFSDYFGNDTDAWREIDLLSTVRKIIGRASSRFTVGEPLCRNEEYIRATFDTVDQTHLETGITLLTPTLLQPIIGQFVGRRANARFAKLAQMIKSEYERRLAMLQYPRGDPQIKDQEPSDYFQIMLRFAQRERPQDLASLETMTRRLFLANFGSMHRTSFQTANMLLNIIDSDAKYNTIDMLREEISCVLTQAGAGANDMASWNRAKLGQLLRADRVARETMRLNSFDNRGSVRKVLADGVTTEDGLPLPRGTVLSFLGHPAQVDEDVYEDAREYDPFRFSRPHEATMAPAGKAEGEEGKVAPSAPGLGAQSFVTTSPYHLPFGHGRTACPGRFLVDLELKMIVAYAVTRYDLEFPAVYGGKRPRPVWLCESMVPPKGAKIRVKRRKV